MEDSIKNISRENRMGHEPILKLLIKMSLPMMVSMLVMALYNIVDSIYVSQISEDALTALSLAFPFQMIIVGIAVGTGIGVSSLIAQSLGAKDQSRADSAATHGLFLAGISSILCAVIFLTLSEPLIRIFETPDTTDAIIHGAIKYLTICGSISVFNMFAAMSEKTLQGTGNMIFPMITQLVGAVTNIILDPIFIFGKYGFPQMGIAGAAIATVVGQAFSMIVGFIFLFRKKTLVTISFKHFKPNLRIIRSIYAVGAASIIMQCIGSFTTMGLNSILISFTPVAVAVLGVYFKIQSFVFMPVFGLNAGALPLMAYNYGARNKKRFTNTLKVAVSAALGLMLIGVAIFNLIPEVLIGFFNPEPEMLEMGINAFRAISLCFPFAAFGIMFTTAFQAVGRGMLGLIVSAARQLFIILPAAYILAHTIGLQAVWYAYPIAECGAMALCTILLVYMYRKNIKPLPDVPPVLGDNTAAETK